MRWLRLLLILMAGALVVPPVAVAARQLAITGFGNNRDGLLLQAGELFAALEVETVSRQQKGFGSHVTIFPYLNCDRSVTDLPEPTAEILTRAFIVEAMHRQRSAYVSNLAEAYSSAALSFLTGCVQASPFARFCAERARDAAYGDISAAPSMTGRFTDASRAKVYCEAVSAILATKVQQ